MKMERLTEYKPRTNSMFPYKLKDEELSTELDSIHKLGLLEDIEEEIGIDLITLFKALKDGIWSSKSGKVEKIEITENLRLVLDYNGSTDKTNFWILDYYEMNADRTNSIDNWWIDNYGKTWALTREELENDNI